MKQSLAIGGSIVIIIGLFVVLSLVNGGEDTSSTYTSFANENESGEVVDTGDARNLCVDHGSEISMHIHPVVTIIVDGEQVPIPANIGIDASCMRALHTHEPDGKIHIEYPEQRDFILADFFANWGETFTANQILDNVVDEDHQIRMTVNGKESTEYGNLVLEDLQQIVIHYETID